MKAVTNAGTKARAYNGPDRRTLLKSSPLEIEASMLQGVVEQVITRLVTAQVPKLIHEGVQQAIVEVQKEKTKEAKQTTSNQNGIKEPGPTGKCRAVWDMLNEVSKREQVSALRARELAKLHGWNERNATIEFYRWKRFHGYSAISETRQ